MNTYFVNGIINGRKFRNEFDLIPTQPRSINDINNEIKYYIFLLFGPSSIILTQSLASGLRSQVKSEKANNQMQEKLQEKINDKYNKYLGGINYT